MEKKTAVLGGSLVKWPQAKRYCSDPLIYMISTRKKGNTKNALQENGWVAKTNMSAALTIDHLRRYVDLWTQLLRVRPLTLLRTLRMI
jgi:hypothetical protein